MGTLFGNFKYEPGGVTTLANSVCLFMKEQVVFSRIKGGERLPTMNEISKATGLFFYQARNVVERLVREGYVHSRPHAGTFALSRDFALAVLAKGRMPSPPVIAPQYVFGATYSLSGSSLRAIANRFKTAHADGIKSKEIHREAYAIAEEAADAEIKEWRKGERVVNDPNKPESLGYVRKIALYSVQHMMQQAAENPDLLKNREAFKRRMRTRMFLTIDAINAAEIAQRQGNGLGFPKSRVNGKSEMGFARFEFDELHFRAVLAALITKDGPVKMADFVQRLSIYQEDILQERKDALLDTPLEPPSVPGSGLVFAESAPKKYKAMEDSEWHRVSAE